MQSQIEKVRAFHQLIGSPEPGSVLEVGESPCESEGRLIIEAALDVTEAAHDFMGRHLRRYERADLAELAAVARVRFMLGEVCEHGRAMIERDEVGLLHELADCLFVLLGTAIQFKLDDALEPAFDEVCRANMRKTPGSSVVAGVRDKGKGAAFAPPDVAGVLSRVRSGQL